MGRGMFISLLLSLPPLVSLGWVLTDADLKLPVGRVSVCLVSVCALGSVQKGLGLVEIVLRQQLYAMGTTLPHRLYSH
jgi:hypothetical protein